LGAVADDLRLDMYLQLKRSPEQELAARLPTCPTGSPEHFHLFE
jgi:hypothetical protein